MSKMSIKRWVRKCNHIVSSQKRVRITNQEIKKELAFIKKYKQIPESY